MRVVTMSKLNIINGVEVYQNPTPQQAQRLVMASINLVCGILDCRDGDSKIMMWCGDDLCADMLDPNHIGDRLGIPINHTLDSVTWFFITKNPLGITDTSVLASRAAITCDLGGAINYLS